jgi:hypothetical protein
MVSHKKIALDFIIDKLTDSIVNTTTGDSFQTEVKRLVKGDLKQIKRNENWNFNWQEELNSTLSEVYKLVISSSPDVIQGLVSFSVRKDHVYMNLVESAPFNLGRAKMYEGVPGNLVAYCCRVSFERGFDGFLSFTSKTKLIEHYENSLGAYHFGNRLMIINSESARKLVDKYFKS